MTSGCETFRGKLYRKAKQEEHFRFYILYDKVRNIRMLREAYRRCRKKSKVKGIDGVSFKTIEEGIGISRFIRNIQEELENKTYKPEAVIRRYVEKANGKMRPIGISTVKDRVIQMSCKMVIEPIFEADFQKQSYGFRPKRSAADAMKEIKENLKMGKTEILDADLSQYFDTIPHNELLKLIGMRISDKDILHLIKMWLKVPVEDNGKFIGGKKKKVGTPQGGVMSPLLSNIYLNVLDKAVNRKGGQYQKRGISIVRYADDFILMGKEMGAEIEWYTKGLLEKLKLSLNMEKTKKVNAKTTSFDFLGFTIRYNKSIYDSQSRYWHVEPSKKSLIKTRGRISEILKKNGHLSPQCLVKELNPVIRGWSNYYTIPNVSYPSRAKGKITWYLYERLRRYYIRKSQRRCKLYKRKAMDVLVRHYGLINPVKHKGKLANA